ncbi:Glutathionylspermidine synthase [Pseudomonas syringae pv. viburni]|uniref:Glutathionylspermidine synthase n=1 Tax=Pseudomonas syringae pv. viburni TaxID=251703 RepID=A0A0Q0K1H0_9PSED|nr:Glutathionylspermidine synthase [Pseudomonas syringae pv. viburni]
MDHFAWRLWQSGLGTQRLGWQEQQRQQQFRRLMERAMKKISIEERPDWRATAEREGFNFHTIDGERYWDERGYYLFTEQQITRDLEAPTQELHQMCMDAVARVVGSEELLHQLAIPPAFFDVIQTSWQQGHPHLYARFDFAYDGTGPAKMYEINADTPTSLMEAGAFQLLWLEEQMARGVLPAHASQFNSIAEDLVRAFAEFSGASPFYFAAMSGSVEDRGTTDFLRRMSVLMPGTSTSRTSGSTTKGVLSTWTGAGSSGCSNCMRGSISFTRHSARACQPAAPSLSSLPGRRSSATRGSCRCCGNSTKAIRTCCLRELIRTSRNRCPRAGCASRTFPAKAPTSKCVRRATRSLRSMVLTPMRLTFFRRIRHFRNLATATR